jgi:ubiquitin-protein ligase
VDGTAAGVNENSAHLMATVLAPAGTPYEGRVFDVHVWYTPVPPPRVRTLETRNSGMKNVYKIESLRCH